ncbi:MAG: septum formation protein Maf [Bdellovibrionales bacterium]|nr:septum formation protein Maf [Bdellovibrionales bacterium]
MELILASTSPYRKAQLENLNLDFEAHRPLFDEEKFKLDNSITPFEMSDLLAQKKAESLRSKFPQALILGCDQIALLDNEILNKPRTEEGAIDQLTKLSGKTHQLITSMFISGPKKSRSHRDITSLSMYKLTAQQIADYVKTDQPLNCAGSYKIEKCGIALFSRIESEDFTAIQGLPLLAFCKAWYNLTGQHCFSSSQKGSD